MSLKSEIDRTELNKNNLVTIKEQTNTSLTQNGFDNIENFSQLPKVLADTLSSCKKIAKQTLNSDEAISGYRTEEGFEISILKPDFIPEDIFLIFDLRFLRGSDSRDTVFKKGVTLSILNKKFNTQCVVEYGSSFIMTGKYDASKGKITVKTQSGSELVDWSASLAKFYFKEVYFMS